MKSFLAVIILLATNNLLACPELRGEYHQCKIIKHVSEEDYSDPVPIEGVQISQPKISSESDGTFIYRIVEISKEAQHGEINPYEIILVGEKRVFIDNLNEEPMTETFSSSCTEKTLDLVFSYKWQDTQSGEQQEMAIKVNFEKMNTKLKIIYNVPNTNTIQETECELK
ncbi:MAG: hypothetical protein HON90_14165 [Halobacteriovoraceae bacterium]|jgi:hypothetical protein|nr:hypothetical protein [Halobacteriovoraceae bacterium]